MVLGNILYPVGISAKQNGEIVLRRLDRGSIDVGNARPKYVGNHEPDFWMDCVTLSRVEHARGIGQVPFILWKLSELAEKGSGGLFSFAFRGSES
jgi:hypothetical protein